jgi:hypothetical protein
MGIFGKVGDIVFSSSGSKADYMRIVKKKKKKNHIEESQKNASSLGNYHFIFVQGLFFFWETGNCLACL